MANCFLLPYDSWTEPTRTLKEKAGYNIVHLNAKEVPSIASKKVFISGVLNKCWMAFKHRKEYKNAEIVVGWGYSTLTPLFLKRLGLIKCKKIVWYGFFLHSPKAIKAVSKVLNIFGKKHLRIVVASESEIELYAKGLSMPKEHILYIPYGDWNENKVISESSDEGYYFSGGYSNRDHLRLLKIFAGRKEKLVIAASKNNTDLWEFYSSTMKNISGGGMRTSGLYGIVPESSLTTC